MNVVLCFPVAEDHVKQISAVPGVQQVINAGQEGIGEAIFEADIFCGHAKVPVDWPEVVRKGRLNWIQSSAAGLDHCLVPSVIDSSIPVTSASGLFANQVAEQTFSLLFGLIRSSPIFFRSQQQRIFERLPTDDLHGKKIGIVGLGGNGRRIAQLLEPFGNTVIATDFFPNQPVPRCVEKIYPHSQLEEVLAQVDIVILTIPLNNQTRKVISTRQFSAMKKGAYFINVARGQVVDEEALVEALRSGQLKAAGLDVTFHEPLPQDSPLWEMENVMISPHVGAQSRFRVPRTVDFFCENLNRFFKRQPLLNLVEKELGFPRPENAWKP